ncbi:hypothetical protein NE235_19755 [Actinoallomurus spadix]|uniref:hypothetical protein n=1 Tax=Actinoallomurus spadix TaxID=79912 RepID=UPI002092871F|nr:hypothetical protein [Actinoallomurus spadix]MCO5988343.1 hypothetical protein [Actinoallomurus spadix]
MRLRHRFPVALTREALDRDVRHVYVLHDPNQDGGSEPHVLEDGVLRQAGPLQAVDEVPFEDR